LIADEAITGFGRLAHREGRYRTEPGSVLESSRGP